MARARIAARPRRQAAGCDRGVARGRRPHRARLGPGAAPRRDPRGRRARHGGRRPHRRPTAARRDRARRAEPERRLLRWPGRADVRDRSRAVRDGPRSPPQGPPTCRPARPARAADARRPRRPHRPWRRSLRADASTRWGRGGARLPGAGVRRAATGSSSRSSRSGASRATPAPSGRPSSKLGGTEWLRAKQRVRKAVAELADDLLALYAARQSADGHRVLGRHAMADGDGGGRSRTRRRSTSCAQRPRSRPTWSATGPMDRLVVGDVGYGKTEVALRGCVQGDPGRQAGRGARADDGARRPAPRDVQPAVRRLPDRGPNAVTVRAGS